MTNENRVPAGSPEGGQFAAGTNAESTITNLSGSMGADEGYYGAIGDRDERIERMKDDLHQSVLDVVNGDQMKAYLDARALNRANSWSFSNRLLAAHQLALRDGDDTLEGVLERVGRLDCGSFKQWKARGRTPVKGSKALYIMAPVTRTITEEDPQHPGQERKRVIMVGTKPMATFDVTQTEGEPVPNHPIKPFTGEVSPGTVEGIRGRYEELGYTYEEQEIPGTDPETLSGALAYVTSDGSKRVVVDSRLSDTQKSQALAHELGHIELGHTEDDERDYRTHRGEMETEAEAFSYMMMRHRGASPRDSETFSPAYIAGWSKGDSKVITRALDRAGKAFDKSSDAIWGQEE